MKREETKKEKNEGVVRVVAGEIRDSVLVEVLWGIITFIPKVIIRIIRNLY